MSDKFLPVPITIQNILYSASEASKEPLATFLKDLFEDIETLKKMDPQPDLKIYKSAIILCNEILKEANNSETE